MNEQKSETAGGGSKPLRAITPDDIRAAFQKEGIYADDALIAAMLARLWTYLNGEEMFRAFREHRGKRKGGGQAASTTQ